MYGLKHQIILDCWTVIENVFILWSFLVALQLLVIVVKLSRSFPTLKSARLWERYYRYSRAEFVICPNSSNHQNVLSVVGQRTTGKYTALPSTIETIQWQTHLCCASSLRADVHHLPAQIRTELECKFCNINLLGCKALWWHVAPPSGH